MRQGRDRQSGRSAEVGAQYSTVRGRRTLSPPIPGLLHIIEQAEWQRPSSPAAAIAGEEIAMSILAEITIERRRGERRALTSAPVWSGRLPEIENIGDQIVGLGVRDYQIRHCVVI